jgi:hypothetical protein
MAQPTGLGTQATTGTSDRGFVLALLAAALAALLLFLPVLLLGYTGYVLAALINGEPLAWQSSVAMTYVFVGIPAAVCLALLVVPYLFCRAASRRIGHDQSAMIIGGLLTIWHAGVAAYWAWASTEGFSHAPTGDVLWYPWAFGVAAVIITILAMRSWIALLPAALVLVLGLLVSGIVRGHTAVPSGAQQVEVEVTATAVRLSPPTVNAGDVYLELVTPRSSITVTEEELLETDIPTHRDFDLRGCTDAQRAEDRGQIGYCGNVFKVTLDARTYVVFSTAADGPGQATARLEVLP